MEKSKVRVLIVEDEKPIARALELKLMHAGFEVRVAFNGEECLECLKVESYDLILLDLIMPLMDGFALLEHLRLRNMSIPVFVLSNLSQEDDERRAKSLGAKEFFIKSNTSIASIVERVTQFLKQPSP